MTRIYLLLTIFLVCYSGFGQELAQPGYVVISHGDTLFGEVQHVKETWSGIDYLNKIRYWNADGKRKKYARSKILGYQAGNETYRKYRISMVPSLNIFRSEYQIVPYGGEEVFLKVLKEGNLSLYEYEWIDGSDDYISSFPLFRRKDETIMVRATQGLLGLKKKALYAYFSDCPKLQEEIKKGTFRFPFEIVNFYNNQCLPSQ